MTPAWNHSYPGEGGWEECGLRPAWVKSSQDSHLNQGLGPVVCAGHSSYPGEVLIGGLQSRSAQT
jgi:hypothetical protein